MTRDEFIKIIDDKVRLIRNEYGYTQDKMADILGISKKTLVQIEKGRSSIGWTGAVALCTIFRGSEILDMISGGQSQDIILTLSFNGYDSGKYEKTWGGKVWWKDIESKGGFKIQQNIISMHYRVLDGDDRRIYSTFEYDLAKKRLEEL